MILHSCDLGAELAARAFPERADVRSIVTRRIVEDLGHARTLRDWLAQCNLARLPPPFPGTFPIDEDALVSAEQQRQRLAGAEEPAAVLDILRLPSRLAAEYSDHAWCVLGTRSGRRWSDPRGEFVFEKRLGP